MAAKGRIAPSENAGNASLVAARFREKAGFKSRSIGTPVVGSKTFKIELPLSDRRPDEEPRQRLGRYFKSVICIGDQSLYHIPPIHINRGWISRDAAKQI